MHVVGNNRYQRQKALLGIIFLFSPLEKEISLSNIQDRIGNCQWKSLLEYYFLHKFNDASELLDDLSELNNNGFLTESSYRYDTRQSERYFKLTPRGIEQGKMAASLFSTDMFEYLEYICEKSAVI